jgi:hypothetical protein
MIPLDTSQPLPVGSKDWAVVAGTSAVAAGAANTEDATSEPPSAEQPRPAETHVAKVCWPRAAKRRTGAAAPEKRLQSVLDLGKRLRLRLRPWLSRSNLSSISTIAWAPAPKVRTSLAGERSGWSHKSN